MTVHEPESEVNFLNKIIIRWAEKLLEIVGGRYINAVHSRYEEYLEKLMSVWEKYIDGVREDCEARRGVVMSEEDPGIEETLYTAILDSKIYLSASSLNISSMTVHKPKQELSFLGKINRELSLKCYGGLLKMIAGGFVDAVNTGYKQHLEKVMSTYEDRLEAVIKKCDALFDATKSEESSAIEETLYASTLDSKVYRSLPGEDASTVDEL